MGLSPTALTLRKLRADGWPLVQVVEIWNPHARIRQDLYGIIDVLAVGPGGVLAVQATARRNVSARLAKIKRSEALPVLTAAGWQVVIWGWEKKKNRWQLGREVAMHTTTRPVEATLHTRHPLHPDDQSFPLGAEIPEAEVKSWSGWTQPTGGLRIWWSEEGLGEIDA